MLPFFDVRLHLDGPNVHLDIHVPADAAALLNHLFAADETALDDA